MLAATRMAAREVAIAESRLLSRVAVFLERARSSPALFVPSTTTGPDRPTFAMRAAAAELACALNRSEQSLWALHACAGQLSRLPDVAGAFRSGELGLTAVRIITDEAARFTGETPAEAWAEFDRVLAGVAATNGPGRLRARARQLRERLDPVPIGVRHARAAADRTVTLENAPDGMAWLNAFLPAADAHRAYARLRAISAHHATQQGETRTRAQLRADALSDLLAGTAGREDSSVRATVEVTVPALNLIATCAGTRTGDARTFAGVPRTVGPRAAADPRAADPRAADFPPVMPTAPRGARRSTGTAGISEGPAGEPAVLRGYGPIDPDTAARLAAGAPSFTRVLVHPHTGTILDVDRTSYRPPADLRRWLALRDRTCVFPACSRPASACEIDHTIPWESGGRTAADNLAHLCKGHHRLKHHSRWDLARTALGGASLGGASSETALTWTAPSGATIVSEPPPF